MNRIMKRVKFEIDENDPESGVKAISFVDQPAIESNFEFFDKAKKVQKFKKLSVNGQEFEGVVHGLALRADYDILRYDEFGEAYVGYFSPETIKKIRNKYHKEMMTNQFNTDHNGENTVDAYLIESFIIDSEERLADVKKRGIDEVGIGDWYVSTKVEDEDTFQRVLSGELNGFSVEIFLNKILEKNNYKKNDNNIMKFIQEQFKEIRARLDKLASEKKKELMEKAKIAGTETIVAYDEVGQPAFVIEINEEGIEVPVPAPAGEHILDNGSAIVVDESGMVVEVKAAAPAQEEPAPVAEEAQVAPVVAEVAPEVAPVVTPEVPSIEDEKKKLAEVYSKQIDDLKQELSIAHAEIEKLKKAPIANPISKKEVLNAAPVKDVSKLSTFERIALKNGISIPEGLVR